MSDKVELKRLIKLRKTCVARGPVPPDLTGWITTSGIHVCAECVGRFVQYNLAAPVRGAKAVLTSDKDSRTFKCEICSDLHENN